MTFLPGCMTIHRQGEEQIHFPVFVINSTNWGEYCPLYIYYGG